MLVSFLTGLYFSSIFCFSFVSHPVYYCLLLLSSSMGVCGLVYILVGFSWYLVLFCLVYVGGVYVLFIFVSVYSPNTFLGSDSNFFIAIVYFLVMSSLMSGCYYMSVDGFIEFSQYLCAGYEGLSYILFCLVLVLGFVCVSLVVNRKDSYYR